MKLFVNHMKERNTPMDPTNVTALPGFEDLRVAELKQRYRELFGAEAKSSNKQFLFRRIAWRLQADREGDLSERARRRAAEIADDRDLRLRAPKQFLTPPDSGFFRIDRTRPQKDGRLPPPGTLLTRRVGDRQIVVKVLADGFEYQSRHYRSLSAIAREATGTRWNGLLFFGLAERRNA
jgi:hypothetical protein